MLNRAFERLAQPGDPLHLAALGVLSGLLSGAVILAFRGVVEGSQSLFLPGGQVGNYEALDAPIRVALPFLGALILGALMTRMAPENRSVGVVHVLHRIASGRPALPLRNAFVQFLAGTFCIISGQSVDREGPGVHLGAASGALLGRAPGIPPEDLKTLIACGAAASIGTAFNTPLAGVVFALELVMEEYSVASFTPVILAAGIGAALSQTIYGPDPAFIVPTIGQYALIELPWVVAVGGLLGVVAALFITLVKIVAQRSRGWSLLPRFGLAGLLTGVLALPAPEIMGVSYDTVDAILRGQLPPAALLLVLVLKLFATAVAIGLGLPGGLIGPTLFIGAAGGEALGSLGRHLAPTATAAASGAGFYAIMGMAAMMGSTLKAPLAALTALLELTGAARDILPGLLVVVSASLTCTSLVGNRSVFSALVELQAESESTR